MVHIYKLNYYPTHSHPTCPFRKFRRGAHVGLEPPSFKSIPMLQLSITKSSEWKKTESVLLCHLVRRQSLPLPPPLRLLFECREMIATQWSVDQFEWNLLSVVVFGNGIVWFVNSMIQRCVRMTGDVRLAYQSWREEFLWREICSSSLVLRNTLLMHYVFPSDFRRVKAHQVF